jgi:hypothetical protein
LSLEVVLESLAAEAPRAGRRRPTIAGAFRLRGSRRGGHRHGTEALGSAGRKPLDDAGLEVFG